MLNEVVYLNPSRQHNNIGVNGYGTEADNMMVVAKRVKTILESTGVFKNVILTEGLTLSQAIKDSNDKGATIHLDIHSDANVGTARGCTGIYKSGKGKQLATCVYKHVSALTPSTDRGLSYRTDLGCLNQTKAVSALVECFFHDNTEDVKFYKANVDAIAHAIANGILEFVGVVKVVLGPVDKITVPGPISTIKYPTGEKYNSYILEVQKLINKNRIFKLLEDGICGTNTMKALDKVFIKRGNKNALVGWVQKMLNVKVDNIYGKAPFHETYDAVIKFQKDNGILVDGIVGKNTILKICKYN